MRAASVRSSRHEIPLQVLHPLFQCNQSRGPCIRVHLKHFIGTSVEIQSDPLRACIHAQLEHHPAEDDDEGWDMWGRAVINVRGG